MAELSECDVISMRPVDSMGCLKAFADIRVGGSLVIRGCPVFDGKNGVFASLPRQYCRDGKWRNVVMASDNGLRESYEKSILKVFEEDVLKAEK